MRGLLAGRGPPRLGQIVEHGIQDASAILASSTALRAAPNLDWREARSGLARRRR